MVVRKADVHVSGLIHRDGGYQSAYGGGNTGALRQAASGNGYDRVVLGGGKERNKRGEKRRAKETHRESHKISPWEESL